MARLNEPRDIWIDVRTLRHVAGLTQRELAAKARISHITVARWELGYSQPASALLPDLAAALGVTLQDLYSTKPPGLKPGASGETHS